MTEINPLEFFVFINNQNYYVYSRKKVSVKFLIIFLIWIILGLLGSGLINLQEWEFLYEWIQLQDNTEKWMTFMSILSTIFAVFFVYSGFAINQNLEKVEEQIRDFKREKQKYEDAMEFWIQLQYCMSFIIQKQFDKAIDSLDVLRKEWFVWYSSKNFNVCNFFLAHCYYEKGTYEDLVIAVDYINLIYEDTELNPFKQEVIEKFQELDRIEQEKSENN